MGILLNLCLVIGVASISIQEALQISNSGSIIDPFDIYDAAEALGEANMLSEAALAFERVLSFPLSAEHRGQVAYNLGHTYEKLGQPQLALKHFQNSVSVVGPQALIKVAWCLKSAGRLMDVVGALEKAQKMNPNDPEIYYLLGDALNNVKQWKRAIEVYQLGLKKLKHLVKDIRSDSRATWLALKLYTGIGDAMVNSKEPFAIKYLEEALELTQTPLEGSTVPLKSDRHSILASLLFAKLHSCLWDSYDSELAELEASLSSLFQVPLNNGSTVQPSFLSPYQALFFPFPEELRTNISKSWCSQYPPKFLPQLNATEPSSQTKFHIGFISRRFEDYPGTFLLMGLFSRFDPSKTIVSCFATGPDDGSVARKQVSQACTHFYDVSRESDERVASIIASKHVDFLIDYDGMHDFNNMGTLSYHGSRKQASFLGFAATTGCQGADNPVQFNIVDRFSAPIRPLGPSFSETLLVLPYSYQPQDPFQSENDGFTRIVDFHSEDSKHRIREIKQKEGIPLDVVVFACFNRLEKLTPQSFDIWMEVLQMVPTSVLWLYGGGSSTRLYKEWSENPNLREQQAWQPLINLWIRAGKYGVDPSRIIFAPRRERAEHLYRHYAIDVFLDGGVYASHTTASDALFTGTPIVTLLQSSFASRVAASLLAGAGEEAYAVGVSATAAEYVQTAKRLADNNAKYAWKLRSSIQTALVETISQVRLIDQGSLSRDKTSSMKIFHPYFFTKELTRLLLASSEDDDVKVLF
jgi:protein O-GlcNAc transferase